MPDGAAPTLGVVVMAYGTPASPADIEAYYTHIRRGSAPSPSQLAELTARYDAIGGISPLAARTEAQRAGLQRALDERAPGRTSVLLGQKHATPFIEDAVAAHAAAGIEQLVGLVLAPHFSRSSVGEYQARLAAEAEVHRLPVGRIDSWHLEPTYLAFLAKAVRDGLDALPERTKVLFTAHSLPERALVGDPYPEQLRASAAAVAEAVGLDRWAGWSPCWQSAGRTADPWRGPDVLDVLRELAESGAADGALVCPQGFVSDHLEVVYDLDIVAARLAGELGLAFARTRVLNDDATVLDALADRVLGRGAGMTSQIVVVGGGISGLVAARDLVRAGATVSLVEPDVPGGKLRTTAFAGGTLDEAADAFLARVPEGVDLCRELGIEGDLTSPAARRAYVWSRGALRLLPEAQVLGVPTDLDELAASGIISPAGLAAARRDLTEPLVAPPGDVAIGALMRDRLGDEVTLRLIDPLVGGINAGDTDQLSLDATVPQLAAAARSGAPSLMAACEAQRAAVADPSAPVFFAPRGGMGTLAAAVLDDALRLGCEIVTGRAVGLERERGRWRVAFEGGRALAADGVLVATPAGSAAGFVRPHAARAATLLAGIPYASVAMVSLAVERSGIDRELDGSGFLVPRVEGRMITGCSWASAKWSHLGDDRTTWLRASVGRDGDDRTLSLGDDALVDAVLADLADTMALRTAPLEVRVSRWPGSFPQYRPGHLDRIDAIEADLATAAPAVVLTGAALRGLGVPACIRQAHAAAERLLLALAP